MQKGAIWKPTWGKKKETSEKCWNFFKSCFNATRAHLKSPGEKKAKIGEWERERFTFSAEERARI